MKLRALTIFILILTPIIAPAQEPGVQAQIEKLEMSINKAQSGADNGWMLFCAALVLMMTIPGLALFYGGLVRQKNVLSTILQSFMIVGLVTLIWAIYGYSLAFSEGGSFLGGFENLFLSGVGAEPNADYAATIPQQTFMIYQLMFAVITPALMTGAFAERIKFSAMIVFTVIWTTFIYLPLAHMVWGKGGFFNYALGGAVPALDFAGGTVVHISSGISALICSIIIGKRLKSEENVPHNTILTVIGACLIWVGWFGFNAGSALSSGGLATNAFVATHFSAAAAMLAWTAIEWLRRGKPSVVGAISGAVAGLVSITPAAGFVSPMSALVIGFASGIICYFAVTKLKYYFGYDDTLDVFGIHGIAGIFGALVTGVLATKEINPIFKDTYGNALPVGWIDGNSAQMFNQLIAAGLTILFAAAGSFVILKFVDLVIGLRVTEEQEIVGLDISQHNETPYAFAPKIIYVEDAQEVFVESSLVPANELVFNAIE